jgi:hypothetical protein
LELKNGGANFFSRGSQIFLGTTKRGRGAGLGRRGVFSQKNKKKSGRFVTNPNFDM